MRGKDCLARKSFSDFDRSRCKEEVAVVTHGLFQETFKSFGGGEMVNMRCQVD